MEIYKKPFMVSDSSKLKGFPAVFALRPTVLTAIKVANLKGNNVIDSAHTSTLTERKNSDSN